MAKRSRLAKESAGKTGFWPKCPFCNAKLGNPYTLRWLDANGQVVRVNFRWQIRDAKFIQCPTCGEQWPVFARDEGSDYSDRAIVETFRTEEHIGDETRRIENDTVATIQRTLRASREWTHRIELGLTDESKTLAESKATIKGVGLTSQVQKSIQRRYSISIGETQKFDDELSIAVPANTSIEVTLSWKRIWQNGYVECGGHENVPFKLCIAITCDVRQRSIT